jgi:hypothetical protein
MSDSSERPWQMLTILHLEHAASETSESGV